MKFLALTYPLERKTFITLAVIAGVCVIAYIYFVASTIFHVTARKDAEYALQVQSALVADLEAQYLSQQQMIARNSDMLELQQIQAKSYVSLAPDRRLTLYDEN